MISVKNWFYITLAHFMSGYNRRLCMLNQSMGMCDLLFPTGFKGTNAVASRRCNSDLGFTVGVLGN